MVEDFYLNLQNILTANQPVEFVNTYFGLPVRCAGRLVRCDEGTAFFSVPRTQMVAMMNNQFTFIQSELLPATVRAQVLRVDWLSGLVELNTFEYTELQLDRRLTDRIVPGQPIQVVMLSESGRKETMVKVMEIAEISLNGLAVIIERILYKASMHGVGKKVFVQYHLPDSNGDEEQVIGYEGIIKNVSMGKKIRIGMEVFPDPGVRLTVKKYIDRRREELKQKIEQLSAMDRLE